MAHSEGDASLSRRRRGFTVAASPFNSVKLDLALIIVVAVVVVLIHKHLAESFLAQLAILAGYGLISMAWLILKTRRISRSVAEENKAMVVDEKK
jgi:hypothetical protein